MQGRISDLSHLAGRRFGDEPALTMLGADTWTFAELDDAVARFAGWMVRAGIGRGSRVVLYLPNGPDWTIAYHAIARIGAVVVPANILLTQAEVAFIIEDAEAAAVILLADHSGADQALGASAVRTIRVASAGRNQTMLPADEPVAPFAVDPGELFTLCYTSGTTGRPKGAMLTHRNVYSSVTLTATIHVRSHGERVLTALPFPHVYGNVVMNAAFLVGMHLLVMPRFEAGRALAAIGESRPSIFEGVPAMYYQMLAHPDFAATDFTSLRMCTVGGQTMPFAKVEEVADRFGVPVCELWGMTEVAGPAASHSPYWPPRYGTVGLPFPTAELRVADLEDASRNAPDGVAGELHIRGPQVTLGYWRDAEATTSAIDGAGWLATGDVAVRDADGYFRIVDRRKDVIITAGYKVYPAELEQVLATHPAVAMAAVTSIDDPEKGELAKAFVVLRPAATCDAAELDTHCRRQLAAYKAPRAYAFVDDLPRTSTGKIKRRALREATNQAEPERLTS